MIDCAIIGGGPAGMNAALVLGRARRKVVLFDDNTPRNAVTQHSHGFITRDGVRPAEFRAIGRQELANYPSIEVHSLRIQSVRKQDDSFELVATGSGERFEARNLILATGMQEILPAVEGIYDYYGRSLFNCPYCDGWELRDQPLVVISEDERGALHLPKILYNWSQDLVLCTNGHHLLSEEHKQFYAHYGIGVIEDKITALLGQEGQLEGLEFEHHPAIKRSGGLVGVQLKPATTIGTELGCEMNALGGIITDEMGRTTLKGVYAAGDSASFMPSQLIIAAASGSKAAAAVNTDLTSQYFEQSV
jgi:thioredoxin reductase